MDGVMVFQIVPFGVFCALHRWIRRVSLHDTPISFYLGVCGLHQGHRTVRELCFGIWHYLWEDFQRGVQAVGG